MNSGLANWTARRRKLITSGPVGTSVRTTARRRLLAVRENKLELMSRVFLSLGVSRADDAPTKVDEAAGRQQQMKKLNTSTFGYIYC